jgi:hypothetical protein
MLKISSGVATVDVKSFRVDGAHFFLCPVSPKWVNPVWKNLFNSKSNGNSWVNVIIFKDDRGGGRYLISDRLVYLCHDGLLTAEDRVHCHYVGLNRGQSGAGIDTSVKKHGFHFYCDFTIPVCSAFICHGLLLRQ